MSLFYLIALFIYMFPCMFSDLEDAFIQSNLGHHKGDKQHIILKCKHPQVSK